jgi:hypothetical protein
MGEEGRSAKCRFKTHHWLRCLPPNWSVLVCWTRKLYDVANFLLASKLVDLTSAASHLCSHVQGSVRVCGTLAGADIKFVCPGIRVSAVPRCQSLSSEKRPHWLWGPCSLVLEQVPAFCPRVKLVGAWSWWLTSIWCRIYEFLELYLYFLGTFIARTWKLLPCVLRFRVLRRPPLVTGMQDLTSSGRLLFFIDLQLGQFVKYDRRTY